MLHEVDLANPTYAKAVFGLAPPPYTEFPNNSEQVVALPQKIPISDTENPLYEPANPVNGSALSGCKVPLQVDIVSDALQSTHNNPRSQAVGENEDKEFSETMEISNPNYETSVPCLPVARDVLHNGHKSEIRRITTNGNSEQVPRVERIGGNFPNTINLLYQPACPAESVPGRHRHRNVPNEERSAAPRKAKKVNKDSGDVSRSAHTENSQRKGINSSLANRELPPVPRDNLNGILSQDASQTSCVTDHPYASPLPVMDFHTITSPAGCQQQRAEYASVAIGEIPHLPTDGRKPSQSVKTNREQKGRRKSRKKESDYTEITEPEKTRRPSNGVKHKSRHRSRSNLVESADNSRSATSDSDERARRASEQPLHIPLYLENQTPRYVDLNTRNIAEYASLSPETRDQQDRSCTHPASVGAKYAWLSNATKMPAGTNQEHGYAKLDPSTKTRPGQKGHCDGTRGDGLVRGRSEADPRPRVEHARNDVSKTLRLLELDGPTDKEETII